ncbi:amidohydrolase family protein [Paracoccus sp. IB05]|nr:amidohydrolase family protein [Paracoccus sp. IB05]MBJ2152868.1 amidohydrolase family protein [Paracoccus sp. IB05]
MPNNLPKSDLVTFVAADAGVTKDQAQAVLDSLRPVIRTNAANGYTIALPGLGRFTEKVRSARSGRNPATGHLHLMMGGASLSMLNMGALFGFDRVRAALLDFAARRPGDEILFGYAVNYVIFGEERPDRHILDRILGDRPLCLIATDLHCAWANTKALELAGILHGADLGPGAEVVMGAGGLASGELREFAAMNRVKILSRLQGRDAMDYRVTGAEGEGAREHDRAVIRAAGDYCARHGITRAVKMDGNAWQAGLMRDLALAGEMPVRVSLPLMLEAKDGVGGIDLPGDFGPDVPGWLSFGRIKLFMDGVFDTWTALTVTDYPDRPGLRSEPLIPPDLFNAICIEADRRGLRITTHAVGDGAVRAVIDGDEAARDANGARDARHRIEHIDTITPSDLDRLGPLGITASMQPVHPPGSAGLPLEPTITIMGAARWPTVFPWAMVLVRDVPLAFGTDWPVSPLSPLYAIHCALTRKPGQPGADAGRVFFSEFDALYPGRAPGLRSMGGAWLPGLGLVGCSAAV